MKNDIVAAGCLAQGCHNDPGLFNQMPGACTMSLKGLRTIPKYDTKKVTQVYVDATCLHVYVL